jgi:hypothetical protein
MYNLTTVVIMTDNLVFGYHESLYWVEFNHLWDEALGSCSFAIYQPFKNTGRHIPKYDDNGDLNDVNPTDLVENFNCETCENCEGEGCEECDFQGFIDWSEPNGIN